MYNLGVSRTNIEIDDALIQKARKLTRLRTKRAIVDRALELLVRTESRKGMLRYYGSGIWEGDLKAARGNRVSPWWIVRSGLIFSVPRRAQRAENCGG